MMKKLFVKFSMLLILLGMSVNAAWGQAMPVYFASLKAQSSPVSTGSGQVKLTWVDITGKQMDVSLAKQINYAAFGGQDLERLRTYDGPAETAQVIGATMCAMDGIEQAMEMDEQIYMTSYVYFHAEAVPGNGSYLAGWTFTDPAVSRIDTAMGNGDDVPFISPCFKVLPDTANNALSSNNQKIGEMAYAVANTEGKYNNIYAIFKKFLLSNPVVTNNGVAGTAENATTTLNVAVDIEGDMSQLKPRYADFALPASTFYQNDSVEWSWALATNPSEMISATKGRAHVVVTFRAKREISEGTYRATFPVRMQGSNPSALNIQLSVYARPANANEASVKIGNADPVEYEKLAAAVAAANGASGDVTLTILKNIEVSSSVTLSNTMTLDLNGYVLSAAATLDMVGQPVLKVAGAGKTITLAYNKQGGAIQAAPAVGAFGVMGGLGVEVAAGTLVLNGGTIASENALTTYTEAAQTAAVKVDAGATLIQNGATITATSAGPNAFGIYNEGTIIIRDGSVRAEAGFNNAMAVYALNGSSTTIDGGSLSALAKEEDGTCDINKAIPTGISTWTNAYAVHAAAGSTVMVNGGDLYAEATNADRAYAVSALAGFGGTLTVNKGATVRAKSPNNMFSFPVAIMAGNVTINGGKFDGKYIDNTTGETSNPAVFGVDYSNFTFVSGTCMTEKFFTEDDRFSTSFEHPAYKNYSVINGSKDYMDGYRYIAVAEDADPAVAVPACRIGSVAYNKLEDAIAYANNNPNEEVVIFMMRDYTLPAGYYTLPAKATIVVPMDDNQSKEINKTAPRVVYNDVVNEKPYEQPTEYRCLTFANGVNMNVFGDIEMTCSQFASNEAYTSLPVGPYGHIVMEEGSHLTLMAGSEVRAWGFMTGKGEMDVRRGAVVREIFQLGDWKGAFTSVKIVGMINEDQGLLYKVVGNDGDKKIFPVTQYFIQNIESPVKYHPGAVLSTSAAVSEGLGEMSISMSAGDIKIVGVNGADQAIFLMDNGADADNTWVRKWYDVENDVQVYEVNSAAHIGSMVLDMGVLNVPLGKQLYSVDVKLNSAKFDLPITCNFKIHLLSGTMDFLQNTCLLPGAEVEVDKESTVTVAMSEEELQAKEQGQDITYYTGALYVYDHDDWKQFAYGTNESETGSYSAYTKTVRYAAGCDGRPAKRKEQTCPDDAKINVHGTFSTATGFVYTSTGGANIFSTNEDAGTFIFNENASEADNPRIVNQVIVEGKDAIGRNTQYEEIKFYPAQLKNGNGEHINTDTAKAGDAYCYINDEWTTMYPDENNPCFMVKHNTNGDVFYAKPQEYVAVAATKDSKTKLISGNDDHTFSDAAGAGRLFILMKDNCQWWEVEKKDNLYHCIHPNNDTYYYWQGETKDPMDTTETIPAHWAEKRFSITWKNWNGDTIKTIGPNEVLVPSYEVTYGTMAEFNGNNPTREANVDSTYNFTGWKPALGPVTQDVTYTATFESQPRMYTIIFQNEGGSEIERHFLTHNAVPACENTPTKTGHYLIWDPAISPVIGDQTYTATWKEELPTEWDVTFVNNAKGELQQTTKVGVNDHPTYSGTTPVKENADHTLYSSNEYTYTFWGWSAVIDGEAQQFAAGDELPLPTAPTTYTAVYTEAAKPYEVKFVTYNGDEANPNHVIASGSYTYGATPVAPTTEEVLAAIADGNTPNYTFNNDKYTYSFAWDPQIQTVMGATNYKVTIDSVINQYTVTLKSNLSGVCTFTGAGTFDYYNNDEKQPGDEGYVEPKTVSVSYYDSEKYIFLGWSDGEENTSRTIASLKSDVTFTANFSIKEESISNLEIADGGSETLTEDTEVKDFILTSNGIDASGQIIGAKYLDIKGEAIFKLTPADGIPARTWYAVASPWQVDVRTGVYANGHHLVAGSDFDVIAFDAEAYALDDNGEGNRNIWKYLDENGGIMEPGKLYMIYLASEQSSVEFHKVAGTSLITTKTSVSVTGGSGDKDNWNAIANPALYHADLGLSGTPDVEKYNPSTGGYVLADIEDMIVAEPIFAQVGTPQSTVAASIAAGGAPAPYRRAPQAQTEDNRFVVEIVRNGQMNDRIIVQTAEEKENTYVIGQDLAKMGIGSKAAQIWMERYNTNLCKNTVEMENGRAEYPLSIFAPAAGEYTISAVQQRGNETLYLTRDGEAIWNLSDGDYTISLSRGTTADYGLRVSARTPQIATGCDEVIADRAEKAQKVLVKDQIFIIRGEKVYTIDGQMVK